MLTLFLAALLWPLVAAPALAQDSTRQDVFDRPAFQPYHVDQRYVQTPAECGADHAITWTAAGWGCVGLTPAQPAQPAESEFTLTRCGGYPQCPASAREVGRYSLGYQGQCERDGNASVLLAVTCYGTRP